MLRATVLAAALALAAPAAAHASGEVFTLAGAGADDTARVEGAPAALAGLEDPTPVAALPDGGFLVGAEGTVWRVDPQGVLHRVAGRLDAEGYTGDDGPALDAEIHVDHLAALPGGGSFALRANTPSESAKRFAGFLLVDEDRQRVRMVAPDGTISTVAGGGTSTADGVPALQAAIDRPVAIAALPGGGFVLDDSEALIREVGPDGRIRTVAGGGKDEKLHGEPATAAALYAADVAVAADGTLLIADAGHDTVDRVAADGTIQVAARAPKGNDAMPQLVTALPNGGFAFAVLLSDDLTGGSVRLFRVDPGGAPRRVAGGGPYAVTAPRGLLRRDDGGPATGVPLPSATALGALPDGGLLFSYETDRGSFDGELVTYVAPDAPAVLAVALRRDRARVFTPGRANVVHVALTLPAAVTLTAGGQSVTRTLPAGTSAVPLPGPLPGRAQTVTVAATDAAGRAAYDRTRVFPPGWLPDATARLVAEAVAGDSFLTECRRFAAGRVDCEAPLPQGRCRAISVRLGRAQLGWAMYRACRPHAHPSYTRGPRRLRRRDWHCESEDPFCRPALFGRVTEAHLIPAD